MLTQTQKTEVVRGNVSGDVAFTIKATARSFEILSSSIYSNKILAIIRELSCNAYDAHVAAGKKDEPIVIHLPTRLDQTFFVRDNGIGLSHEDIIGLYSTYFSSTKTDSNDFIGALGLGSKSPFSYASTFTVESRFNNTKRIYTCFKNEEGLPSITLMDEAPTDECNGITVSMAVKRDDVDKFHSEAKKALMYFSPQPSVIGQTNFLPFSLKHTITGKTWKIRESDYYAHMDGAYVVQGFVAYPIQSSVLAESNVSESVRNLLKMNIDVHVSIGDVEVAASREALSYDKRTVVNLITYFEEAAAEMRSSFQAEFNKCTSAWEVAILYDKFDRSNDNNFRSVFRFLHTESPFQWNGAEVKNEFVLDFSAIQNTTIQRTKLHRTSKTTRLNSDGMWTPTHVTKETTYTVVSNTHILIDTEAKGNNDLICQYLADLPEINRRAAALIVLRPAVKNGFNQQEVDNIIKMLGNPEAKKLSDLPYTKTKKTSSYVKKDAALKMVWNGFSTKETRRYRNDVHRVFSRKCWKNEIINLADGGFYVKVNRFDVQHEGRSVEYLDQIIEYAAELNLIPNDIKIIGLNEKEQSAVVPGNSKWVYLIDYIEQAFITKVDKSQLIDCAAFDMAMNQIGSYFKSNVVNRWSKLENQLVDGPFKQCISKFFSLSYNSTPINVGHVKRLIELLHVCQYNVEKEANKLHHEYDQVVSRYKMLRFVGWSSGIDDDIVEYINLVDAV